MTRSLRKFVDTPLARCALLSGGVICEDAVYVSDGLELAIQVLVRGRDAAVADSETTRG
jgi:hypothetical protein